MKRMLALACGGIAATTAFGAPDPAPIVSAGLFKNGNVVLVRRITPENGVATVEIPECLPAYGTFWHASQTPVKVTTVREPVKVEVVFRADSRIGALLADAEKNPDRTVTVSALPGETPSDAFFTVEGECLESRLQESLRIRLASGSVVAVDKSLVVSSKGLEDPETGAERKSRYWRFEGGEEPFLVGYLTKGAAWAPSYLLRLGRDDRAVLLMSAEIRNEIADWQDVDVSLISGFPSILYAGANALIGDRQIGEFAQEIGQTESGGAGRFLAKARAGALSQVASFIPGEFKAGASLAAYGAEGLEAGSGSDVHYRPVGRLSLGKDATVMLPLGAKETDVKRIVDWHIGDSRNIWGQPERNVENGQEQELWDSVKFKNPFDFPLSTGAIEIAEDGRIVGQAQCKWTNPGDETLTRITKALSVKGWYDEESDGKGVRSKIESLAPGERFRYNGSDYRKEEVTAKIRVRNFRKDPATLNVKKVFSGELVESDFDPAKTRNLPARDGRANVERELVWEFDLMPGETKEIKIVYWLWVMM
ncbi:MAG: DUF4139 domain-containing protein [Kiritimatiellae bacterium]|nr:DUF4139 domain-containing protein [Kiritimatiellia bacterium]